MALKFEVDSIDGLDEGIRGLYTEHEGKYRLQVEGIDPADELKTALKKERDESKGAKARLAELERLQEEADKKRLEEKQEYEKLYKSEKESKAKTAQELEELRRTISETKRAEIASKIASALTRDTKRAELLKKEALAYIQNTPDGVQIVDMTEAQLTARLTEEYPFLIDGSGASGGGASGGKGGGTAKTISREQFAGLDAMKQMAFIKDGGKITE